MAKKKKELAPVSLPVLQLTAASNLFAAVCEKIDSAEDITDTLKAEFNAERLAVRETVDMAIEFKRQLEYGVHSQRQRRDFHASRKNAFEAALETFKAQVHDVVKSLPGQPFEGSGGRLAIQANGASAVVTDFDDKVITKEHVEMFGIDDKYVKVETTYTLRSQVIADDLKKGVEIPWARLDKGTHVRFWES